MKKFFFLTVISLSTALFFSSCEREVGPDDIYTRVKMVEKSFSAVFEEDETKTAMIGQNVVWQSNDEIKIHGANTSVSTRPTKTSTDRRTATFVADVAEGDQLYAVYPSTLNSQLSGSTVSFTVPSVPANANFATANIEVGKEVGGYFLFSPVTAVFQFTVNSSRYPGATHVRIDGLRKGSVSVDMSGSSQVVTCNGEPGFYIVPVSAGKMYVSVLPETCSDFKFSILSGGTTLRTVTYSNALYARPGKLYDFGDLSEHIDEYTLFDLEPFDKCVASGPGANFNTFGSVIPAGSENSKTRNSGWSFNNCYECSGSILVGDGTNGGYAITPALGISTGVATVIFDVAHFSGAASRYKVKIEGAGYINSEEVIMKIKDNSWNISSQLYICGANASTRLRFYTHSNTGRFYLDNVKVIDGCPDFNYLNVPEENFVIEAEGGVTNVTFYANNSLNTFENASYATAAVGSGVVVVRVDPNESADSRSFNVDISSRANSRSLSFTQLGKTKVEAAVDNLTFAAAGGTMTDNLTLWNFGDDLQVSAISSNGQFSASVSSGVLSVTAAANNGEDPVSGQIFITASDSERTRKDTVYVLQKASPVVMLDPTSISVGCAGDTLGVKVNAKNFEGTVSLSASSGNSAFSAAVSGTDSVTVFIPRNTTSSAISGDITITATDGASSKTATVAVTVAGDPSVVTPTAQNLVFKKDAATVTALNGYYGTAFVAPTLEGAMTAVTYSIVCDPASPACATIDATTGAVTLNQVNGTATVTASAPAGTVSDVSYLSGSASYTITVKRLPEGIVEQESLVSNGTKHIETGFVPKNDTRVVVDYKFTNATSSGYLFGSFEQDEASGASGIRQFVFNMGSSGVFAKFGSERNQFTDDSIFSNTRHTLDWNGNSIKFDNGTPVSATAKDDVFTCPQQMFIFYSSKPSGNTQTTVSGGKATIWFFKIYDGSTLVRDYVPCTRTSDSVEGLYDLVGQTFCPMISNT